MKTHGPGGLALLLFATACGTSPESFDVDWTEPHPRRLAVTVEIGRTPVEDRPVVVTLGTENAVPDADAALDVVEIDATGAVLTSRPAFQYDFVEGGGELTLWLSGTTAAHATRRFLVYFGGNAGPPLTDDGPGVRLAGVFEDRANPAVRIETEAGAWTYHTNGAGFAALVDRDGNDWLGWRPGDGAGGEYRGIPNLVYPEGYFHPGGGDCETRVTATGPLRVVLESACAGGAWATRWELFPHHATLTVIRAEHPYWFLYEGTPGGSLEPDDDYYGLSDGTRHAAAEARDDDLPGPEWLYFGDPGAGRVLWLAHHEDDRHPDAYYAMEGRMTVFGFGRRRVKSFVDGTPGRFSVGLHEGEDHARIAAAVASALGPVRCSTGPLEPR